MNQGSFKPYLRTEKEMPNYKSLADYVLYLKENFNTTSKIYEGRFYSFLYKFERKGIKWEKLKYYDIHPFPFIFRLEKDRCYGINFHHASLVGRHDWLERVVKLSKDLSSTIHWIDLDNRRLFKINTLRYPQVYKILLRMKMTIRCYRYDRMSLIRPIPLWQVPEIMNYYANTWLAVNQANIEKRWKETRIYK